MNGITYKTEHLQHNEVLVVMNDPLWRSPWFLKDVRNGKYSWTRNDLFAKGFSPKTAAKHKNALEHGADKEWEFFHNEWAKF